VLKRTTVFLGREQLKALDTIARKEGVSTAELIRWAIERLRADYRESDLPRVPPEHVRAKRGRPPKARKGEKS
jgi:Ribbon-helix-helix protein, copG family